MSMTFIVIHGLVCDPDVFWSFMDWFVIMTFLVIHRLVCDHDVSGHSWTGL